MRKKTGLWTGIAAVSTASILLLVGCRADRGSSTSPSNSPSPTAQQVAVMDDLRKLAASQCGISAQAIDVDAPIQKQGCDDLDMVELVMTIEDKYNITISDADADGASLNTLARIINRR